MRKRTLIAIAAIAIIGGCAGLADDEAATDAGNTDTYEAVDNDPTYEDTITDSNAEIGSALCDGFRDVGVPITMELWVVTMADDLHDEADGEALGWITTSAVDQECPEYLPDVLAWAESL